MEGDRERCLDSGMDSYLSKPVEPKQLFQILDQFALLAEPDTPATPCSKSLKKKTAIKE